MDGYTAGNRDHLYQIITCAVLLGSLLYFLLYCMGERGLFDMGLEDYGIGAAMNLSVSELFVYIVQKRMGQILIFWLLQAVVTYYTASVLYGGIWGLFYGCMASNLFLKFGYIGILYSVGCFFPHYILYFGAMRWYGKWLGGNETGNFDNINKFKYLLKIIVIILLVVLAMAWEILIQKNILNYFNQYVV